MPRHAESAARTEGDTMTIDPTLLEDLAAGFAGRLVTPDDGDYESVRAIWNGQITTRPAVVAQCTGTADVIAAVRFAREHDIEVSVRGGGHSVAGLALTDGGMVIDLSLMNGVRADPIERRARVAGGALWSDADRETQAFGLGFTGGIVTHTGVGGLTLGGGIGHLMRKYGLTIDALRSCDVVTADGEFLVASEDDNADLFWGLRGGGGNFGVVTNFEFELYPVGPTVLAGLLAWPMDQAPDVLRFFREFVADAPDEVGIMGNLRLAPPLPVVPEELHGKPIVGLVVCYVGPIEEAEEVLRPLREFQSPAVDGIMPKPYRAHQMMFDAAVPHGNHYYWKSWKLPPLDDDLIDVIVEHCSKITSPLATVPLFCQGGAVSRVEDDATAYAGRQAAHDLNIVTSWLPEDPEPDRHVQWVRDFYAAVEPWAQGAYVNFLSDEEGDHLQRVYGEAKLSRLVSLKSKYDPTNFFHLNSNIPPNGS